MQQTILVGREKEASTLQSLLVTGESELVSVIGRRRVGKTFLVQSVYAGRIAFEITGIQNATLKEQLGRQAPCCGRNMRFCRFLDDTEGGAQ